MLDEPFANIDPSTQIRLKNMIREISREKQLTTIISSHDLNHVTDVCQRILLMEKGKIIKDIETNQQYPWKNWKTIFQFWRSIMQFTRLSFNIYIS